MSDASLDIRVSGVSARDIAVAGYDEDWIQDLVFEHPELLPVAELDHAFDGMIPVCRELPTDAGPPDALFINEDGLLTLVELPGTVWQRRFWEHPIRNETDWRRHMDYIHFNPVKHGLVESPVAWKWSSFRACVRRGWYPEAWGAGDVGTDVVAMDCE